MEVKSMYERQEEPEFRYRGVKADYRDPEIPSYKGNPLIEALPPIYKEEEVASLLRYDPGYDEHYRQWAPELRLHLILDAVRFIQPLSHHIGLEQLIGSLLRSGYVGRNPFTTKAYHLKSRDQLQRMREGLKALPPPQPTGREISVIGLSGVGKSTAMRSILSLYDQVTNHGTYQSQPFTLRQLVYLKLECPQDGSLAGLCKAFFKEVDRLLETNTYHLFVRNGRRTIDEMVIDMAGVAARHFLGILIIDEIQNLREAKGEGASHVLNFLVQLGNELGIPVVLIGTPKAQSILTGEFRRARRASGFGAFPWDRMEEDEEWNLFTDTLWKYQYVRKPTPLTDELRHTLYFESQGITDLAVKVYMLAQAEAIARATNDEEEEVTKKLIESVAQDRLRFMQRFLNTLRRNQPEELKKYEDIAPLDLAFAVNEAITTLRRRHTETAKTSIAEEEQTKAAAPADTEHKSQGEDSPKKKPDTDEAKQVLIKTIAKGKLDEMAGYEALKAGGYIRSAWDYQRNGSMGSTIVTLDGELIHEV
jgi:ABC-type dipeptide/oligopeptide/nickel transport system ATPase component